MRILAAFFILSACATLPAKPAALSVHEVSQQQDALNGKVIRVSGVVRHCQRLSCALISPTNKLHFISIGNSETFDQDIRQHLNREVVVEGMLDSRCVNDFDLGDYAVCADRPDSLANPSLVWPKR